MRSTSRARIVVPLLVFAAVLVAIELGVRLTLPHYASRDFFLTLFGDPPDGTPKDQQPLFEGDPVRFWRLRPNVERTIWDFTVVSTNAQGIRHDRPIEDKPAGRFRILCVGDSVTFGYRIPLVFPDKPDEYDRNDAPYAGRLERLLREQFPGRDIEVIALAVPGYSTFQGRSLLEDTIDWLEPDVVVLCFGFNDVAMKHFPDRVVMSRAFFPTAARTVMSSSQTLLHAWRWWTDRPDAPRVRVPQPEPRVSRKDYVANVAAMAALAKEHGAAVLVLGAVYRDRTTNPKEAARMTQYRKDLRAAMQERGIPYLQIDELTEDAAATNGPQFGEHVHPSSIGHQTIAEHLRDKLRADGVLAPLVGGDAASS